MPVRYLPILLLPFVAACASVVEGNRQTVSVETPPVQEARCTLVNDGGTYFVSSTPGSVTVTRSAQDLVVTCERSGFEGRTVSVSSTTKALAFGNILAGGLIGAAIDRGTGAAFDYPALITVPLVPTAQRDGLPPRDTPASNVEDRLRAIIRLRDQGTISPAEYEDQRRRILSGL